MYLSITMPLEWVDVNVHPTKTEVALLHEETVADCLRQAVEETLLAHEDTRTMRVQTTLIELTQLTHQTELNSQAAKAAVDTEKGRGVGTKMNSGTAAEPATTATATNTTLPAPTTKKTQASYKRPDKLVRVDAQSQTLQQLLSAPARKNRRSNATFDLGTDANAGNTHEGLREILRENVLVGWVDAERLLLQKGTKLYLLDVGELSRDLFFQLAMSMSQRANDNGGVNNDVDDHVAALQHRLTLCPPPSVSELLLIALTATNDATNDATDGTADKTTDEVAGLLCKLLARHADWLEATFGVVVSFDGGRLVQLPNLGPVDIDASRLPDFVLSLAAEVDWTDVEVRRRGVAESLAELYRLREGDDEERSRATWKEVKASLFPERRRATDGSVVELTRLEQLYRTFERC